jgi:hypothetical protein
MNLIDSESILLDTLEHLELCHARLFDELCHPKDDITQALNIVFEETKETVNTMRKKANDPENHGKPWTSTEEERLKKLFIKRFDPNNDDLFYREVSRKFKRKIGGIKSRLQKMGLINYPYSPEFSRRVLYELRQSR